MPVTLVASNKHIKKSRSETRKHSSFKDKGQSNIFIQDQVTTRVAGFSSMCWKRLIIHNNCNIEMTITCDELFLVTEFKGRVMHIKPATSVRGRRATQSWTKKHTQDSGTSPHLDTGFRSIICINLRHGRKAFDPCDVEISDIASSPHRGYIASKISIHAM